MVADIVADIVADARRRSAIYGWGRLHAPWGLGVAAGAIATVHIVTAGACWLLPEGGEPVHLCRGDVVLVRAGLPHSLVDHPDRPVVPMEQVIGGNLVDGKPHHFVLAGEGPGTGLLCGGFLLEPGPRHPLTTIVPPIVHIDANQSIGTGLAAAVALLASEATRNDPGGPAVIASLVDLLFVYILRAWLAEQRGCDGWVRALYDPVVGRALTLIHQHPGHPWSVATLARAVATPRATFSRRFTALAGQAPMAYLTNWRMTVAARLLRQQPTPLRDVARQVGYDSEFAFARAFKRVVGHPPGRFRRAAEIDRL